MIKKCNKPEVDTLLDISNHGATYKMVANLYDDNECLQTGKDYFSSPSPELHAQPLFPIYTPSSYRGSEIDHASVNWLASGQSLAAKKQVVTESSNVINHFSLEKKCETGPLPKRPVLACSSRAIHHERENNVKLERMGEDFILPEDSPCHLTHVVKDVEFSSQQSALKFGLHFNALRASSCNTNNSNIYISKTALSETDMTNEVASEKRSKNIQNGVDEIEQAVMNYLSDAARVSEKESASYCSDQAEGQTNRQRKPQPGESLLRRELSSCNDSTRYTTLTGADKSEQLTVASSLTTSASFMSPQDQSLLATPGSSCSPRHDMNSPPDSNPNIPENNFQAIEEQYSRESDNSKTDTLGMQTQIHSGYVNNQAMRIANDCSNNNCDKFEGDVDTRENGDSVVQRKISSDTIYPWMKESRQNQKKKQNTSVSSG